MNAPPIIQQRQQRLLATVGDPSRFRIFLLLAERERFVTELAATLGLSQSCTTRHLQALVEVGLVRARREGKRVVMRLRSEVPEVAGLLAWARLGALADVSASEAGQGSTSERREAAAQSPRRPRKAPAATAGRRRGRGSTATPPVPETPVPHSAAISGTPSAPESPPAARRRPDPLEDYLL